jgi:Protein of unknown function (DUF3006)
MSEYPAVVERIEGNKAVLEPLSGGESFIVPVDLLPEGAREGSVVNASFQLDPETETARRERIRELQKKMSEES